MTDLRTYSLILTVLLSTDPIRAQDGEVQGEFPIGAWFPGLFINDETQWNARLQLVDDANFNTIHASLENQTTARRHRVFTNADLNQKNQIWMREAQRLGLKVQLYSWPLPSGWRGDEYWAQTFEAEDNTHFTHNSLHGSPTAGVGVSARVVDHSAGLMLDTPPGDTGAGIRIRGNSHNDYTHHVFWLSTDKTTGPDVPDVELARIRTIITWRDNAGNSHTAPTTEEPIRRSQFLAANVSQDFPVTPMNIPSDGIDDRILVRYQIYWTDRGNLTVDRIRAHDLPGHLLFRGDHDADIEMDLRDYYDDAGVDPPWRFYLYDEPQWQEVHESMAYIDEIIQRETATGGRPGRKGVSAFNQRGPRHRPHIDDYELLSNVVDRGSRPHRVDGIKEESVSSG